MQATKIMLTTDQNGHLVEQPRLPPNAEIEAIFLVVQQSESHNAKRQPSPRIAGQGKILDDLTAPVVDPDEWDALR
jgi:hypothetical protein